MLSTSKNEYLELDIWAVFPPYFVRVKNFKCITWENKLSSFQRISSMKVDVKLSKGNFLSCDLKKDYMYIFWISNADSFLC